MHWIKTRGNKTWSSPSISEISLDQTGHRHVLRNLSWLCKCWLCFNSYIVYNWKCWRFIHYLKFQLLGSLLEKKIRWKNRMYIFFLQLFHNTPNRSNLEKCRYLISGSRNISESSSVASQNFPDLIYQNLKKNSWFFSVKSDDPLKTILKLWIKRQHIKIMACWAISKCSAFVFNSILFWESKRKILYLLPSKRLGKYSNPLKICWGTFATSCLYMPV